MSENFNYNSSEQLPVTLESLREKESSLASRAGKAGVLGTALLGISMALAPMDAEAQTKTTGYNNQGEVNRVIKDQLREYCQRADELVSAETRKYVIEDPTGFTVTVRKTNEGDNLVSVKFSGTLGKPGSWGYEYYGTRQEINCSFTNED